MGNLPSSLAGSSARIISIISPRTLRGRLTRGAIVGRKRGGRWVVPRDALPLPESEHKRLQERANAIRHTVEAALPSRITGTRKRRSVVDEIGFRAAHALRTELRASSHPAAAAAALAVEEGLVALGAALHEWAPRPRIAHLTTARAALSRATVTLLLHGPLPPDEPVRGWVVALEHEILPPLAGLFRRAEQRAASPDRGRR